MKNFYFLIISSFVLSSCNTETQKITESVQQNSTENKDLISIDSLNKIANIIESNSLDSKKFRGINIKLGRDLYKLSSNKIQDKELMISDSLKERLYKLAALGAEVSENYNNAITYYYQAQRNFPESKNAPEYLHIRARIIEEKLEDKESARLAYEELIEFYPNHQLSKISLEYISNPLYDKKTDAEIIKFLQSQK